MRKLLVIVALALSACGGGGGGGGGGAVATPTFSPGGGAFSTKPSVTINCATTGAVISYTTDGSVPTPSSPVYSTALAITTTTTVKAYATAPGMTASAVASATYTLQAGAPVLSPAPATYATAQGVTLTSATPGAAIHYTTDGTAPTAASPSYSTPIALALGASATTTTVKALATAAGFQDSTVTSGTYVIDASATPAATPTFSPAAGSFAAAQSVTISTTTSGASIYYTLDGSTPTTASTLYAGPVAVATSLTLKAIATATGYLTSDVGTAAFVIGASGTDFATVCTAFLNAQVDLLTTCFHANPDWVSSVLGAQQGFCAARQKEVTAGLIHYDATQGAACASAVGAMTCADVFGQNVNAPASCDAALVGTVANGTGVANQCYASNDCADGFCTWDLANGTCPGRCQAYPGLGGDCSNAICASGQSCGSATGAMVCAANATTVGGPCPCADDLWCDTSGGGAGTCRALLAQGAACSTSSDRCATGLMCVGTSPTCTPLVGLGGACTPSASGPTECGPGYSCDAGTSKCVSWPKVGESCAGTFQCIGAYCDFLSNPTSPICAALLADGATCTSSMQCSSMNCDTATTHTCLTGSNSSCVMP